MRRSKLRKLATEYADKTFPLNETDCRKMAANLRGIESEVIHHLEMKLNPNCKNRKFSSNDCKKEAEEYWAVLSDRKRALETKFIQMNCRTQLSEEEFKETMADFDEELSDTEGEVLESIGWQKFAVYGAGLSVVLLGTYLILRKKK